MKEEIHAQLQALRDNRNIRIMMAVESGSRAWGFPSPDSDYDVRIIYIKKIEDYLSIGQSKDTIDYFHGKLLDINGWDIRKALSLLRKSNATPFEWAQSPIVYEEVPDFRQELLALAHDFFQPYHTLNHYKGIALNSYKLNPLSGEIKLKKLFYVIRPILAARWVKERQTVPPMDIDNLLTVLGESSIKDSILQLIEIKKGQDEDFVYHIDPAIKSYIDAQMQHISEPSGLEKREIPETEVLNVWFRKWLYQSEG